MKKLLVMSMVVVMVVAMFTGCGNSKKTTESTTPSTKQGSGEVDKSKKLVIYSNSASNGRGEWLTENAAKEGFNVEIVSIPGGELTNRLIAEKNNSLADLVYGLNTLEYEKLKKEDLLLKYEPDWADEVDMTLGDPDSYYYPIVVQPLVLIYNKEYTDAPKDWIDLATNDKYKDQYNIFSLSGGTAKNVLSSILARYTDPNGEYGISDEGWEIARKYIQNAHTEVKGEDYVGAVIDGSRPMTMMWGSGVIQHQNERNYKFGIMSPEVGVPYVTEQIGIISKTNKAELAKAFANWFGSPDVQAEWSAQFGSIPAHPKALETVSDDIKQFIGKVHAQDIDWGLVAENIDMWVEKAELEFVK